VRELILRFARENSHWGYVRIVRELRKLGITVSATLVRNVLARAGIPPAPERGASSWRSFLRQQGNTILACDLSVEGWSRQRVAVISAHLRLRWVGCSKAVVRTARAPRLILVRGVFAPAT